MLPSIIHARLQSRLVTFGYLCLLATLGWGLFSPSPSQAGLSPQPQLQSQNWTADDDQIFVVYRNERGEFACRNATKTERERISDRRGGGSTTLIYDGAPRETSKSGEQKSTSVSPLNLALQPSAGLRIVLHGTTQLKQNQQANNAFIVAANRWEAIISTPITVVLDVDFGPTFFGQAYDDPNILGATGTANLVGPYTDLRQRLISGASNASESQLYNALPASKVPVELNGSTSSFTSARVTRPNGRALGIVPNITNPDSLSLGQGDAGIGFNSAFPFDFNPDDGITSNLVDFDSVATHEIGHALGFVSNSGSGNTAVSVWDLFRFRPGAVSLANFATVPRVMTIGGTQVFFSNQLSTFATLELGLSTGGPDPSPTTGDGRQSSHWRDDVIFSVNQYIGIMDPTLDDGVRRVLSENDRKAIDLFGYSIGGPPLLRPPNDNFANAISLPTGSGSINGTSVNATREAGEPVHAGFLGDKSIWYKWTSPVTGQVTFDTVGSNFDTTLATYIGVALNTLSLVQQNDDIAGGGNRTSRVQFNVNAGTTYSIAVDGWNGEFGNVTLNWVSSGVAPTPTPTPTPTPMPPIQLLLDETGPALDQVAGLDSLLFSRDPFPVVNLGDLLNQGNDRNTRVIVFTKDLLLAQGAPASSVLVNLVDSNNQAFDVAAEEVRAVSGSEFIQVTFRLPDSLASGTCTIRVKLLDRTSNAGSLRIKP